MHAYRALAASLANTDGMAMSAGCHVSSANDGDAVSLIGTWHLLLADDRPDGNGQCAYSYGEHPWGYLVYDNTGHMFVQFSNDPPTAPFAWGDDYQPTAKETASAYANVAAYVGTYRVDRARHAISRHVEGSLEPGYTATDQERPHKLQGDRLELGDGQNWRRVWVRVSRPSYAVARTANDQVPGAGIRCAAQRENWPAR